MKITKSWRSGGYLSVKFLGGLLCLGMVFGFLVPQVFAAELGQGDVKTVSPGAGTLKKAVQEAKDGDVLKLKAGSYTGNLSEGRDVEIDKTITIEGEGIGRTMIDVPLKITGADKEVEIKNLSTPMPELEKNFIYISIEAKAKLTLEKVNIWGILRDFPVHDAKGIDITPEANGCELVLDDSKILRPGLHYGIQNRASDTTITLNNNSVVEGRVAIEFDSGSNNTLNINSGSEVSGPSLQYRDTDTIAIKDQTRLKINLDNGNVTGNRLSSGTPINVFAFDEKSTGTKINLKNNSVIKYEVKKEETGRENTIFAFNENAKAADDNIVTVDASSRIYRAVIDSSGYETIGEEKAEVEREYSTLNNGAVIGVFDKDGGRIIKVYDEGNTIDGLEDKNHTSKEGYSFEGWFKKLDDEGVYSDEFAKEGESYPTAKIGQNMDLYPKFLKQIKVKIGDDTFDLKEGQTLNDIQGVDIDEKLNALKNNSANFKGFVMHGEEGSGFSVTTQDLAELKQQSIPEDVTIEAVHDVTLTVNGQEFTLEIGQTVANLDQTEYEAAKFNGQDAKYFSRLVYDDGGDETFDELTPITANTKVVTKFYLPVKVEGDETEYLVEEGNKLAEDKVGTLMEALKAAQEAPVENKSFGRFVDSKNKDVDLENYTVNEATTIKPIYTVDVKIGENTYKLDEGTTLKDHSENDNIAEALKQLAENVKAAGREFTGFVVSSAGNEELVSVEDDNELDAKIQEILEKRIEGNTDIYAKYVAIVTIECPECDGRKAEFEVETGSKLTDLNGDAKYEKAKYQQYESDLERDERFGGFETEGGELFTEEREIEKSMTLKPKYYLFVTIEDERPEVSGKFRIEPGKDLDEMVPMSGQATDTAAVLFTLRSDITPEVGADGQIDPNAEDLHFDKLVKVVGGNMSDLTDEIINEDNTTIRAMYHYDVIVVEDYNNPNADLGGVHSGTCGFKVYRGEGLGSVTDKLQEIENALTGLKNTANNPDLGRRFYRFYDEKLGVTYDADALKNKAFNRHLYITAKVEYRVKVEGDTSEYYVVEGETVGSSEALKGEMTELRGVQNKQFAGYTWNNEAISETELLKKTVNKGNNEIGAKYNIIVTIDGEEQPFVVPEGKTLGELESSEQERARAALLALQNKVEGQTLEEYNVGGATIEDVMRYPFEINTEVTVGKTSITVTIDEIPYEDLVSGDTIAEALATELESHKARCADNDMEFSRFADEKMNDFDEKTPLAKNETLTTMCAYKVTIDGDDTYRVEEGKSLNDVLKVAGKLNELEMAKPEKTFGRFVDADDENVTIDRTVPLTKNVTIKPIYSVTVKLGGNSYTLDENSSLNDLDDLSAILDALENPDGKLFGTYVVEGHELNHEGLLDYVFGDNAEVTVKYNVAVSVGEDDPVIVPEGTRLGDAIEVKGKMDAYAVPEGKSRVAYFVVDENENPVNDDLVFATNTVLTPKYMIAVRVTGQDDEGEPIEVEPLELEMLENSSLSGLPESEKQKLQDWVKENQLALAETGKEKYDLDHFVNEQGETVGMETPLGGESVELTAVFAYKPEAVTPEEPTPTPETTPSEGSNENTNNAGAPDTGSETANEVSANMGDAAIVILAVLVSGTMAAVVYRRHRKNDAK